MTHIPFILRDITDNDTSFVYSSFLQSYHDHYPAKFIPDTLYFKPQGKILDFLLGTATCLIACFPEDPEEIIGWILFQKVSHALVIHYIYVKQQHRMKYFASDIIKDVVGTDHLIIATHICDHYNSLKYKVKNCKVVYDPYLVTKLREINDAR